MWDERVGVLAAQRLDERRAAAGARSRPVATRRGLRLRLGGLLLRWGGWLAGAPTAVSR